MSIHKFVVHGVLVLQFVLSPAFVLARTPTAAEKQQLSDQIIKSVFDFAVDLSSLVETPRDFERYLLFGHKESDRRAIMRVLQHQKHFPTLQRMGTTLVLDSGVSRYDLKWLAVGTKEFEINGVKWVYDSEKPFMPQYETLARDIKKKKTAGIQWPQILPEAEAAFFIPALLMVGSIATGVIASDLINEAYCWSLDRVNTPTQKCAEMKKKAEEAMFDDAPSLDAVSNQVGSDNTNVVARYESDEWKCPTNNDGKEREYRGRLRSVETKEGKTNPVSDWFNVVAKFNPKGFPTDLIISRSDSDPNTLDTTSKSGTEKLVIHIAFDPTKKKPISYRLPNPRYNPSRDLLGKPTINLMPTMKLEPGQKEAIERAKDIVRYINYRNYNCVAKQIEQNQLAGISTASPAEPPKEPTPTAK